MKYGSVWKAALLVLLLGSARLGWGLQGLQFRRSESQLPLPRPADPQTLLCRLKARADEVVNFTSVAETRGRLRRRYGSCAVVSNSGVLREHFHAKDVDAADLVLRFNDAPTRGFESLVGQRDDVRIVNDDFPLVTARHFSDLLAAGSDPEEIAFVVVPMKPSSAPDAMRKEFPANDVLRLTTEGQQALAALIRELYAPGWFASAKSRDPTSGLNGMMLALTLCDEVRTFGMASTKRASRESYHYWQTWGSAEENSWHQSFSAEKDLWRRVSSTPLEDIERLDMAVVPGFSSLSCPYGLASSTS